MGNCVPVQQRQDPAKKIQCSTHSQRNSIHIESSLKDSTGVADQLKELISKPQLLPPMPYEESFRDLSNAEEMFFDSQAWLDSDCEDFVSVSGDFTPSCATSPIHQDSFIETPQRDESLDIGSTANSIQEPSPTDMKRQLIELFRESFNSESVNDDQNAQERMNAKLVTGYLPQNCRSPYESLPNSGHSSDMTTHRRLNTGKEKSTNSTQCCLPNLMRSLSYSERKRKLSPDYSG